MRTLPPASPCWSVPWRELPVGARFLCVAAGLLLRALTAWERRRRRCR